MYVCVSLHCNYKLTLFVMKNFENRFGANVELRNIGDGAVAAKVIMSLRLDHLDSALVSDRILSALLPLWVKPLRLYDGSYILVSAASDHLVSNLCVPCDDLHLADFDANIELEDGLNHSVHFSLDQSASNHRDYVILDTRFIQLRGKIAVEIEDDGTVEE